MDRKADQKAQAPGWSGERLANVIVIPQPFIRLKHSISRRYAFPVRVVRVVRG